MPEWIDFGAPAACGAHRFRLEIPQASRAAVTLYEDMGFAGDGSRPEGALLRARVKRSCWSAVSELVMREFNERLQAGKRLPGRWRTGGVWLERMLGRELCVLCWALEHAASRAEALRMANAWQGFRPEERLWLFGRTARFAPLADDCQRGWRRALALMMGEAAPSARLRRREGAAGLGGEEGAQIFLKLES